MKIYTVCMQTPKKTAEKVKISFAKNFTEENVLSESSFETLHELFSLSDEQMLADRRRIVEKGDDAELFFSLSPKRGSLVSWYPFGSRKKILEIDSGTGAVTEALAATDNEVVALNSSRKTATINAMRNKDRDNLSIFCGDLAELEKSTYDYIVCSDASRYSDDLSAFLARLLPHLKKNGAILFGITNRIGLRYWTGSREER